MRATAHTEEGNLVRLSVEVDETEVDDALDETVRELSRKAKIPGFRPGKVPRRVLEARMGGSGALRAEALREALPDFYAKAVAETDVDPIAAPEIDVKSGEEGGPVSFDAVVQVRPTVSIPGYEGLQVTVPSLSVKDEEIDAQVDRLRENDGELVSVGRPAIDGDHVTLDLHGSDPLGNEIAGVDDYLYEVGSGTVVPELDEELRGSKPGIVLAFTATQTEGPELSFKGLVKDVQEKLLPEATDEWVKENSEFTTLEELREDVATRIGKVKLVQAQFAMRESSLGALVELVDDDEVPAVLVEDEVRQRIYDLEARLNERKMSIEQFLEATGSTAEDFVGRLRAEARGAVKADLALRAIADAEKLEVTDDEFEAEVAEMAAQANVSPSRMAESLDRAGRTSAVRSIQLKRKALAWLIEHVDLIDDEGNAVSREALREDLGEEGGDADDGARDTETGSEDVSERAVDVEPEEVE